MENMRDFFPEMWNLNRKKKEEYAEREQNQWLKETSYNAKIGRTS